MRISNGHPVDIQVECAYPGNCHASHPHGTYSDSKNWFTKGNFLLARSFVAQETKIKSWEILTTKKGIVSLFVPTTKTLAQLADLIQDLQ